MNIAGFAVKRPVLTIMCSLLTLLMGLVSLSRLPIDLFPDMTRPIITISTDYDNAGPEDVEESVTMKVEEAVSAVEGVKKVTSISREENSRVYVEFEWGTNLDEATNDIRDRLDRIIKNLPDGFDRPTIRKYNTDNIPILFLGIESNMDMLKTTKMLEDQVVYRFERLPGVGEFSLHGERVRQIQVNLNYNKIMALKLDIKDIEQKISQNNLNYSAGTIDDGSFEVNMRTFGQFNYLEELGKTAVATTPDGDVVRLDQIAEIKDTNEKVSRIAYLNGKPGLVAIVRKRSGYNTVAVANEVMEEVKRVNRDFPQVHIISIVNNATFIENAISNVSATALQGVWLAVLILLLFLRNIRSTLIIAVSIPLSIIGTFALIYFAKYTLNMMTIGGLALGIGMLVDNSIVVLENITRHRDRGESGPAAAIDGTQEVTAPVIASTLTTLAVFLPLVFMRGMAGILFQEFSSVVAFSLLCSLVVAVTVVPMIAARVVKPSRGRKGFSGRLFTASGRMLDGLDLGYKHLIDIVLNHRLVTGLIVLALLGAVLFLAKFVGTELMPVTDEGRIRVSVELAEGTRLANTNEFMRTVEAIVQKNVPESRTNLTLAGEGSTHIGTIRMTLVDIKRRSRSSEEIAAALRKALTGLPGARIRVRAEASRISGGGAGGEESIQIKIRGHEIDTAYNICHQIEDALADIPGVTDTRVNQDKGAPEDKVILDREKLNSVKVSVDAIAKTLRTIVAGVVSCKFRQGGDESDILIKIKDADRMKPEDVLDQIVLNRDGKPIVLRNLVSVQRGRAPTQINRENRERTMTVLVNIGDRPLGDVVNDIRRKIDAAIVMPPGFSYYISGDYEEQAESFRELLFSLIMAILLVYMVMASQFESFLHPLVVMFSVPLSIIGVVLLLLLTGTTFNMQSFIGCIMLAGIVVNNAILLVDQTNQNREKRHLNIRDALEEAGRSRLRPILMTTLTTVLGLLPMSLGLGSGGETQAPLARAVIGGLTSSTLITLLIIPVVYSLLESLISFLKQRLKRWFSGDSEAVAEQS
ncbi:MAG: efflux RND transporter permease subunit [Victivallaceae bacterium]|nr:efflux RND transporter permease subunit [Victivallaceae bacterium]